MNMNVFMFLAISILVWSFFGSVRAQGSQGAMQAFYDSTIFGMRIQANATTQVQPVENITIILTLTSQVDSLVKYFNVSIFGFLNGTDSISMSNKSDNDFWLNSTSRSYNWTLPVPEWVSGMTYAEVWLKNSNYYPFPGGTTIIDNDGLVCGFYMTNVENVYLAKLERDFNDLTQNYDQLNKTFNDLTQNYDQLNKTCIELEQNLTALRGNSNELASTREVAAVLGVSTVVFVATTMYLILRKPKQYW